MKLAIREPWYQVLARAVAPVAVAVSFVGLRSVWIYPPALLVLGGQLVGRPHWGLVAALMVETVITYRHGLAAFLAYGGVMFAWMEGRSRWLSVLVFGVASALTTLRWLGWVAAVAIAVALILERRVYGTTLPSG